MRVWKHLAALAIVGLFCCGVAVAQEAADRKSADSVQLNPRGTGGLLPEALRELPRCEKKQEGRPAAGYAQSRAVNKRRSRTVAGSARRAQPR